MCGIFFSLSRHDFTTPDSHTEQLLRKRGPDSLGINRVVVPANPSTPEAPSSDLQATFIATVLSLRGTSLTKQPLRDEDTGSILCWNGEAWSITNQPVSGSDSRAVFDALIAPLPEDISVSETSAIEHAVQVFSSIRGPYAFVFYDARNQLVFYGRDCLGRRSLLNKIDDAFVLSSVCDNTTGDNWTEVEADGIYVLDLKRTPTSSLPVTTHIPHRRRRDDSLGGLHFVGKSQTQRSPLNWSGHSVPDDEPFHRREFFNPTHGHYCQNWSLPTQLT